MTDEGDRRWLTAADVQVVGLRVALLGTVGPLVAAAYGEVATWPGADTIALKLIGLRLAPTPDWFWRFVLFLVLAVVLPVSIVERVAGRPGTRRRASLAALLAALVTIPGAIVALAQSAYVGDALVGGVTRGGASAWAAVGQVLAQPPREVAGQALASLAPFAVVTWLRVRGLRLPLAWPAALLVSAAAAALSLQVVAGHPRQEWLQWRTEFWTALVTALLLPPAFHAADRLQAAWRARSDPPAPAPVG